MDITALGDSALIIRVRPDSAFGTAEALAAVLEARDRLERAAIPGVVELATAYTTVAVWFDPLRIGGEPSQPATGGLIKRIRQVLAADEPRAAPVVARPIVEIPFCCDPAFAPDLADVARHASLPEEDVVDRYAAAAYLVQCVGFTPGFPYLSGLPDALAMPRRATPRSRVPAGSVAIGGRQTGIYPTASPGGWNIIGRTPLRLFDAMREAPALLRAGDRVVFRRISRAEFDRWRG